MDCHFYSTIGAVGGGNYNAERIMLAFTRFVVKGMFLTEYGTSVSYKMVNAWSMHWKIRNQRNLIDIVLK